MPIYDCQLRHGPDGRIAEKTETVAGRPVTWTYAYDGEGRLTGAHLDGRTVCDINYDREGRRMSDYFPHLDTHYRNYGYSVIDNRLQQAGNNGYTHDDNGFRSIWNSAGKYTLYEYAPDYRLLKAEKRKTGEVFEFAHDKEGRREAKYCNGELVEAYRWLDFLRLEGFHDGEFAYRFTYRDGERTPYAMEREDGTVASLYYDQVGSLRVVADAAGNVIKEVLYDPFGGIIEDTNPGFCFPIGFAGGLHDRDLGFVRFGWRDYDTFTSRWTAPDPIGDEGGDPDWYGYCLDDPVNGNDPTGLFFLGGAGLAALGGLALATAGVGSAGLAADGLGAMTGKNKDDPFKATKGAAKGLGLAATVVAPAAAARVVPIAAANPTLLTQGAEAARRIGGKAKEMVKPVADKVMPHGKTIEKSARIINDTVNDSMPPETFEGSVLNATKYYGKKIVDAFGEMHVDRGSHEKNKKTSSSDWWGR